MVSVNIHSPEMREFPSSLSINYQVANLRSDLIEKMKLESLPYLSNEINLVICSNGHLIIPDHI